MIENVQHERKMLWNNEHAYRLHQSIAKFPKEIFNGGPFYIVLVDGFVQDDYEIQEREYGPGLPEEGVCYVVQQSDSECNACKDNKARVRISGAPDPLNGLYEESGIINGHPAYILTGSLKPLNPNPNPKCLTLTLSA